jgi:uncharacterized protein involved in exopolysaccharide biosynthesis
MRTMGDNRELKVNMIDVLELLVKRKGFILGFTFLATLAASIATFIVHPRYAAETVLMPPSSSEASGIKNILKSTPLGKIGGIDKLAGAVPTDLADTYLAILGSRSLQLEVIRKFNLAHVYKFDKQKRYYIEDLLKEFNKHFDFDQTDEGTLVVSIIDQNPQRAAEMANYMVQQLDETYKRLMTEKNRNYRIFLGERLDITRRDMAIAEKNLVGFQKRNKMMDVASQAKATLATGVNLEARYLALKGSLEVAKRTYSADHPKVRELQILVDQLEKQRRALSGDKVSDFLLPYQAGPDIALEYLRLAREVEVQQTIFEIMVQQYEEAKFEESKNTPTVQVLDRADPPQKRVYPQRKKLVLLAFAAAFMLSSIWVLLLEFLAVFNRNQPEEASRIRKLLRQACTFRTRP